MFYITRTEKLKQLWEEFDRVYQVLEDAEIPDLNDSCFANDIHSKAYEAYLTALGQLQDSLLNGNSDVSIESNQNLFI